VTSGHTHGLPAPSEAILVVVFLSGSRRGTTVRLGGERSCVGTDPSCAVRIPSDTEPLPLPHHATLTRRGDTYEITTSPDAEVWVNGEAVEHLVLASGDVLEIGRDGALLRFRIYEAGIEPYKSLPQVFEDCLECARMEQTVVRKASSFATGVPRELVTNTSRSFRAFMVLALLSLTAAIVVLGNRNAELQDQLTDEIQRVEGLSALVETASAQKLNADDLAEVATELRATRDRVDSLEARSTANARVVAAAAQATLFLQGSYRFMEPGTDRPLRMILGPDGRPVANPFGHPALSLEGEGPPLEIFVTGTGFVASADGLVVTNRHVAIPWEFDDAASGILASGFRAEWNRFVGYLPDIAGPFDVELMVAADDADLAVLEAVDMSGRLPFVSLANAAPVPGDAVIVVGYPLGLRALMARSEAYFVAQLQSDGVVDFYEQAERLSLAGFMQPLATRGIVGQVTSARVVYDAETTSGGSGGPVLTLAGEVVAVNTAILPEFGGSNLGVPADRVRALLDRAEGN